MLIDHNRLKNKVNSVNLRNYLERVTLIETEAGAESRMSIIPSFLTNENDSRS